MKKFFLFTFLLGALVNKTNAQSKANEDSVKAEIMKLSKQWSEAIVNRDSVTLEKILSPEFTLNGSLPRNKWISNTLHNIVTDSLKVVGDQKITIYGGAAISEATWYWKASFGNQEINSEYWVNDIWKKDNGHWQVLIRMTKDSKKRN